MSDSPGSSENDLRYHLQKAKKKLQNQQKEEAQGILRRIRRGMEDEKIEPILTSRIKMAESDAKLGRTNVLDDLIAELEENEDLD